MNFAMLYGLIPIKGCEGPPGKTGERGNKSCMLTACNGSSNIHRR